MNKEQILEKLQYYIRTLVLRSSDETFDKVGFGKQMVDLSKEVEKLDKTEYDWLQLNYETWFEKELANHPEIQKLRQLMVYP